MNEMNRGWYGGAWAQFLDHVDPRPQVRPPQSLLRMLVAVDVTGFGRSERDNEAQVVVRRSLWELLEESFAASRIKRRRCRWEDRGDGVLIVVSPDVSADVLLDQVVHHLREGLRNHNLGAREAERIQLRMAIHSGHVLFDDHGVTGHALTRLFRILEAPQFKEAFSVTGTELGLIVSDQIYKDLIMHRSGRIDRSMYQRTEVGVKETKTIAWSHITPSTTRNSLKLTSPRGSSAAMKSRGS
jgi:hypothetical protein